MLMKLVFVEVLNLVIAVNIYHYQTWAFCTTSATNSPLEWRASSSPSISNNFTKFFISNILKLF